MSDALLARAIEKLPPADRRPFTRLAKELMAHGERWGLFILQFEHDNERQRVADAVQTLMPASTTVVAQGMDWLPIEGRMVELVTQGASAIQLFGLERWLDPLREGATVARLRAWNIRREAFSQAVPAPVLCWLRPEQVQQMAVFAPDLWSWRRSVHRFVAEDGGGVEPPWLASRPYAPSSDIDNRTPSQRRARIEEINAYRVDPPEHDSPRLSAALDAERAALADSLGDFEGALQIRMQHVLPAVQRSGDTEALARTWGEIAGSLQALDRLDEAMQLRQEQLRLYDSLQNTRAFAETIGRVADIHARQHRFDDALRLIESELPVYAALSDERATADALGREADLLVAMGRADEALALLLEQVLPTCQRLGDVRAEAIAFGRIATALMAMKRLDEALRALTQQALPRFERVGDERSVALTLDRIAHVHELRGEWAEALDIRRTMALPIHARIGDPQAMALTQDRIAELRARLKVDPPAAG